MRPNNRCNKYLVFFFHLLVPITVMVDNFNEPHISDGVFDQIFNLFFLVQNRRIQLLSSSILQRMWSGKFISPFLVSVLEFVHVEIRS
jgi:hypothetical protein